MRQGMFEAKMKHLQTSRQSVVPTMNQHLRAFAVSETATTKDTKRYFIAGYGQLMFAFI